MSVNIGGLSFSLPFSFCLVFLVENDNDAILSNKYDNKKSPTSTTMRATTKWATLLEGASDNSRTTRESISADDIVSIFQCTGKSPKITLIVYVTHKTRMDVVYISSGGSLWKLIADILSQIKNMIKSDWTNQQQHIHFVNPEMNIMRYQKANTNRAKQKAKKKTIRWHFRLLHVFNFYCFVFFLLRDFLATLNVCVLNIGWWWWLWCMYRSFVRSFVHSFINILYCFAIIVCAVRMCVRQFINKSTFMPYYCMYFISNREGIQIQVPSIPNDIAYNSRKKGSQLKLKRSLEMRMRIWHKHTLTRTICVSSFFLSFVRSFVRWRIFLLVRMWIDGLENGDIKIGKIECARTEHANIYGTRLLVADQKSQWYLTEWDREKSESYNSQMTTTTTVTANVPFFGNKIGYK